MRRPRGLTYIRPNVLLMAVIEMCYARVGAMTPQATQTSAAVILFFCHGIKNKLFEEAANSSQTSQQQNDHQNYCKQG
jgi:hypothetical protein